MDYKELKTAIYKSAEKAGGKKDTDFVINLDVLTEQVAKEGLNLLPIPVGLHAHRIHMDDVPLFAEYYRPDRLEWLNDNRFVTSLAFVDKDKVDDELLEMIEMLKQPREDHPDVDYVNMYGAIIANYPCYFALVASYKNNSPEYFGKNSYFIGVRANKVVIKDPNYVYNPQDITQ